MKNSKTYGLVGFNVLHSYCL